MSDSDRPEKRLNRALAETGFCSRRKADELIFKNHVSVNGIIQNNPAFKVTDSDTLAIDGRRIACEDEKLYLMLNKPIHTVCTLHDPEGRKTVVDILPDEFKKYRLYPVGRLDYFSEGLLLLTNDGDFANRLSHPRYNHRKIYEVIIRGKVSDSIVKDIEKGITLDDGTPLLPIPVKRIPLKNGNTLLVMTLSQGINRLIRKICAKYGLVVLQLKRIAQGKLRMGNLPCGSCRKLTDNEVKMFTGETGENHMPQG